MGKITMPSHEETAAALETSIAHWRANVDGPIENATTAWYDCALCLVFAQGLECEGCPVHKRTNLIDCINTPFDMAFSLHHAVRYVSGSEAEFRIAAKAELDFLISLREETV